jgi:glucan phosphoethanolaminetransferase (alkaline phosphatase superfamily)
MGKSVKSKQFNKFLYGFLFVIVLPASLFLWAAGTEKYIKLLVPVSSFTGIFISVFGMLLMFTDERFSPCTRRSVFNNERTRKIC